MVSFGDREFQIQLRWSSKRQPKHNEIWRGVFVNAQGEILRLYEGNIGTYTNKDAKIKALEHGLAIAKLHNLIPLIIEGDSTLETQAI